MVKTSVSRHKAPSRFFLREWPTWGMIALCYTVWLLGLMLCSGGLAWLGYPLLAVTAAMHASLQHEALHGHPTRNATMNEALVYLPLALAFPYRRFKTLHLRHHRDERLTDPYDDPESWYHTRAQWQRFSPPVRWLLTVNNTLAGRMIIGPVLMVAVFIWTDGKAVLRAERGVARAWLHHLAGAAMVLWLVAGVFALSIPAYVLFVVWPALSLLTIRTFCEHQWADRAEERTVIVENSRVLSWLFLHNSLHVVHHAEPARPWYDLPRRYREAREQWVARNNAYVFASYTEIAKAYLFRVKEPVVHPALPHTNGQSQQSRKNNAAGESFVSSIRAKPQMR